LNARRKRSRSGAATFEALLVLPVVAILWLGYLYVHALARHVAAASSAARARSWAHAFDGCRGREDGGGDECADAFALDVARTGQPSVDDRMGDLLGSWTSRDAETGFPRPVWLGAKTLQITARACVPCNPVPRESFEVVRRVYEDSTAGATGAPADR
jgi:hypothetical protein